MWICRKESLLSATPEAKAPTEAIIEVLAAVEEAVVEVTEILTIKNHPHKNQPMKKTWIKTWIIILKAVQRAWIKIWIII